MPLMTWNERLSVGVASLDEDHKKLVAMLNQLFDAINSGHGKEALAKILDDLIAYAKTHFAHEETFFTRTSYPQFAEHKLEHDEFTRQVLEVQQKGKNGATGTLSLELMNFLKNWLVDHIQGSDKKYGPHLNRKGIR
jgi:hemerythrin